MYTQIIILIFGLHSISAHTLARKESETDTVRNRRQIDYLGIPAAPILPELDVLSLPDYVQRLLANNPSYEKLLQIANSDLSNGNVYDYGDGLTTRYNNMNSRISDGIRPDDGPRTYGMSLKNGQGYSWNDLTPESTYPTSALENKFENLMIEPTAINDYNIGGNIYDEEGVNSHYPSYVVEGNKDAEINKPVEKPKENVDVTDKIYTPQPKVTNPQPVAIKNIKLETSFPTSPKLLPEKVTPLAIDDEDKAVPIAERDSPDLRQLEHKNESEAEKTVSPTEPITSDYNTSTNSKDKELYKPKTFGMDLKGNRGRVWNNVNSPGIQYNVGDMGTDHTTEDIVKDDNKSEKFNLDDLLKKDEFWNWLTKWTTAYMEVLNEHIKKLVNYEVTQQLEKNGAKTPTETVVIKNSDNGDDENKKDKDEKSSSDNIDASPKQLKEIGMNEIEDKPVTQENTGNNITDTDTNEQKEDIEKESSNNSTTKMDNQKRKDVPALNVAAESKFSNAVGNDHVTNVFIFYPNDNINKILESILNGTTVFGKPVTANETVDTPEIDNVYIINTEKKSSSICSNDEKKADDSQILNNSNTEPKESLDVTSTTESNKRDNDSGDITDKKTEESKNNEISKQATTAETPNNNTVTSDSDAATNAGGDEGNNNITDSPSPNNEISTVTDLNTSDTKPNSDELEHLDKSKDSKDDKPEVAEADNTTISDKKPDSRK